MGPWLNSKATHFNLGKCRFGPDVYGAWGRGVQGGRLSFLTTFTGSAGTKALAEEMNGRVGKLAEIRFYRDGTLEGKSRMR